MPTDYTDGPILADSFDATIGASIYTVNNFNISAPSVEASRTDKSGAVAAWRGKADNGNMTGTAELQIDSEEKVEDIRFVPFKVPADSNPLGEEIWCIVTSITSNTTINTSRTISVNVRKLINAPEQPAPPTPPEG